MGTQYWTSVGSLTCCELTIDCNGCIMPGDGIPQPFSTSSRPYILPAISVMLPECMRGWKSAMFWVCFPTSSLYSTKYPFLLAFTNTSPCLWGDYLIVNFFVFPWWLVLLITFIYELAVHLSLRKMAIKFNSHCFLAIECYGFFIYFPYWSLIKCTAHSYLRAALLLPVFFAGHKLWNLKPLLWLLLLPEVGGLYPTDALSLPLVRTFMALVTNKSLLHFNHCICCKMKVILHFLLLVYTAFRTSPIEENTYV